MFSSSETDSFFFPRSFSAMMVCEISPIYPNMSLPLVFTPIFLQCVSITSSSSSITMISSNFAAKSFMSFTGSGFTIPSLRYETVSPSASFAYW